MFRAVVVYQQTIPERGHDAKRKKDKKKEEEEERVGAMASLPWEASFVLVLVLVPGFVIMYACLVLHGMLLAAF